MARIAERFQQVRTAEDLHTLLEEIAATARSRWTRTQVLFYLPEALHRVAAEYFEGERLVVPQRLPVQVRAVGSVDLDEALREAAELQGGAGAESIRPRATPVERLECDPPESEHDLIGNLLHALRQEIREVERSAPKRYRLLNGRCTGPQGGGFVYLFAWSSEPDLFVPGQLVIGKKTYAARVGGQGEEGKQFELVTEEFLGATIGKAIFRVDPTFLLRTSFDKLKGYREVYDPATSLAGRLLEPPAPVAVTASIPDDHGLNVGQKHAVSTARAAAVGYVWGPPGTGKTTSLGVLVRELVRAGKRVLVLSPYNTAVDQALRAVHSRGTSRRGELVRFGRISPEMRQFGIDLDALLEGYAESSGLLDLSRRLHSAVMAQLKVPDRPAPATVRRCLEEMGEVVVRLGERGSRGTDIDAIQRAMKRIKNRFRAPEADILNSASVVGTTAALSFMSPLVYGRPYDHVIVDEASVVRTPDAVLIALMSGSPITFFGDPKQLPAIVQCRTPETARWLKRTPFDLAGIQRPGDAKGSCAMLRQQHRMAPPIRRLVSETFYENALEDGHCPAEGRVMVLDSSRTPATASAKWIRMSQSKENLVHRGIVASLLDALRREDRTSSILVLSPFRAQKIAYEREPATNRFSKVRFATVHTSQGDESDIVLIDFVLAPGRGKTRFMDERRTPEFRNLLNVAMSRAKRQLILLAHVEQVRSEVPDGLLDEVLRLAAAVGEMYNVPANLRMNRFWRESLAQLDASVMVG